MAIEPTTPYLVRTRRKYALVLAIMLLLGQFIIISALFGSLGIPMLLIFVSFGLALLAALLVPLFIILTQQKNKKVPRGPPALSPDASENSHSLARKSSLSIENKEENKEVKNSVVETIKSELQIKFRIPEKVLKDPLWEKVGPDWETLRKNVTIFPQILLIESFPVQYLVFLAGIKADEKLIQEHRLYWERHESITPMHLAAWRGDTILIELLYFKFNLDPQQKDFYGRTLLHYAAWGGHAATVDTLESKYDLDPQQKDFNGRTLLHYAARGGHVEAVETLAKTYGLDPHQETFEGWTLPHFAAQGGHAAAVEILIEKYELETTTRAFPDSKIMTVQYSALLHSLHTYSQLIYLGLPVGAPLPTSQDESDQEELRGIHLAYLFSNVKIISQNSLTEKLPQPLINIVHEYAGPCLNKQKEVDSFLKQIEAFNEQIFAPLTSLVGHFPYFFLTTEQKEAKKLLRVLRPSSTTSLFFIQKKMSEIEKRDPPESKAVEAMLTQVKKNYLLS